MQRKRRTTQYNLDEIELANSCVNAPDPESREEARAIFLRTIRDVRPDVLDSLNRDVWPAHKALFRPDRGMPINQVLHRKSKDTVLFDPWASHWYNYPFWNWVNFFRYNWADMVSSPLHRKIVCLKNSLSSWAEHFHLTDDWCLDYVLLTLYDWSFSDQPVIDWHSCHRLPEVPIDPKRKFKFEFSAWHVDAEDWASYEKRLQDSLKKTILAYRAFQEAKADSEKIIPARKKREMMHYRWLVDFHIPQADGRTLSDSEIAAKHGGGTSLDRSTVYDAIHSTASLIGLTLRKR